MKQRTLEQAIELANQSNEITTFNEIVGDESTSYQGSRTGAVRPCGCIEYSTILSDGSLGWGGWDEKCNKHFFEDR